MSQSFVLLYSVVSVPMGEFKMGDEIELTLMRRERNSLFALPVEDYFPDVNAKIGVERSTSIEAASSSLENSKSDASWSDSSGAVDEKNVSIVTQPSLFLTLSALKNENIDETLVLTDVVCLGHFLYINFSLKW